MSGNLSNVSISLKENKLKFHVINEHLHLKQMLYEVRWVSFVFILIVFR